MDPHFNDPSRSVDYSNFKTIEPQSSKPMRGRYRDKRGAYQSIDFDQRQLKDIEGSENLVVDISLNYSGPDLNHNQRVPSHLRTSSTEAPMPISGLTDLNGLDASVQHLNTSSQKSQHAHP